MDTYNKLMALMNEKVLKNVNTAIIGSRGKSTDKSTNLIPKPTIMNHSSSNKRMKTYTTNVTH